MKKKVLWFLFAALSVIIGLYPLMYLLMDGKVGLLNAKPDWLLANVVWSYMFYTHIVLGGVSLFIGWTQFSSRFRDRNLKLHRQIGKVYVISVLLSAISGFYIALYAEAGFWSSFGFSCLAVIWFYTTLAAYLAIKNKHVLRHQKMMIYSYGACFAAVTLRIWLPILTSVLGDYTTAYIVVAWWCWIPNLLIAYLITTRLSRKKFLL